MVSAVSNPRLSPEPDMRSVEGRARRSDLVANMREAPRSSRWASKLEEGREVFVLSLERYALLLGRDGEAEDGEDMYRISFQADRNDVEQWARATLWAAETRA